MKIAIYSGTIPSTVFIENLIKGLAGSQEKILLFGTKIKDIKYENPNIRQYTTPNGRLKLLYSVLSKAILLFIKDRKAFVKLYRYIKTKNIFNIRLWGKYLPVICHRPDIFHIQWAKSVEEWIFLKEIYSIKLIVSFRGAHINYSPIAYPELADTYKRILPLYDGYHAVSQAILQQSLQYGVDKTKAEVIYPSVEDHLLSLNQNRRTRQLTQQDTLQILSIGRNHWKKGYNIALDACKILKDKNIHFHYKIVAGNNIEELIFQVNDLNLQDNITFIDALPHKEVLGLYGKSDIFLLPSVEEGVANVVLESMALGCPVITTDCGGMKEAIIDKQSGFVVPLRNPEAIAEALEYIYNTGGEILNTITINAIKEIKNKHLLSKQVSGMKKLYEKVLSNPSKSN